MLMHGSNWKKKNSHIWGQFQQISHKGVNFHMWRTLIIIIIIIHQLRPNACLKE